MRPPDITLDEIYQKAADLIPPSRQYPSVTAARIAIDNRQFVTDPFEETNWRQSAEITVEGEKIGAIDVFYLKEMPPEAEGPFLKEERDLVDAIAELLGVTIEKKKMENKVVEYQRDLEKLVEKRTELLDETGRLAKIGGWEFDLETMTPSFTEEIYRIFGLSPTTPLSIEEGIKYYAPEAQPVIKEAFTKPIEQGEKYDLELPFITSEEKHIWVRTIGKPRYVGAKIVRVFGSMQDITELKEAEEALKTSEAKFRELIENAPIGIAITTPKGEVIDSNQAITDLFGYKSKKEALSMPVSQHYYDAKERERFMEEFKKGPVKGFETRFKRKDGTVFWASISSVMHISPNGESQIISSFEDIDDRRKAEKTLRESENRFKMLNLASPDAVISINDLGMIISWNQAAGKMFGYGPDEIVGQNLIKLIPERYRERHRQALKSSAETGKMKSAGEKLEFEALRKDGSEFPIELGVAKTESRTGTSFIGVIRDVTERRAAQEKIKNMAYHDQLTKLPNRRLLRDRLSQALAQSERIKKMIAVMFLDLDGFKKVNDTYGHEVGDLLLLDVAKKLTDSVRKTDTVARMGGDEFVVSLANVTDSNDVKNMANEMLLKLSEPIVLSGNDIQVSASIGISFYPIDDDRIDPLLSKADKALYEAKKENNCFVFYESIEKAA
ncbi:MAG TPA: PAS domain S-box protein [Actinobacteria bacterium]|nr:PAS domain S-box protein [Actinomycetota bacterium]